MPQYDENTGTETDIDLNHRERATLRAVADGSAELTCRRVPDLLLDGLAYSDQATAYRLVRDGLIAPAHQGQPGDRVPAVLTKSGERALAATPALIT